ncbi:MAG: PaaI family thioesterase [Mailhella sp.]|nr:PaaI family thioesterase [Mailhella sp.]MBQ8664319.1 PaaI family thioesterase [Mailhella sp.]MBQ9105319.1 PaaI family thioesterase [Mailhella sp.]
MKDESRPKVLHEVMGMELLPSAPGEACARMAVTHTVCQPFGFLSGGASLALAETLAGYGSLSLCEEGEVPLGVQVSANHVHAVPLGGEVRATARLLSKSRTLHVWNVDIVDGEGRLVSTSRVTNCIKKRIKP